MMKKLNQKTLKHYIPLLANSLRLTSNPQTLEDYFKEVKTRPSREGYSWESRVRRWTEQNIVQYGMLGTSVLPDSTTIVMPLFEQLWQRAQKLSGETNMWEEDKYYSKPCKDFLTCVNEGQDVKKARTKQAELSASQIQEENNMLDNVKDTVSTVIDQNKEAGILAAELSVGRTANEFIAKKLIKTLPWYKRVFADSWLSKLVVAQIANAVIQQTSDNTKLQTIGEAMLKESVVEATVYSDTLTGIIAGLEEAVSIPQLDKLIKNK